MKKPNWIFLGGDLKSVADIDAALSTAAPGVDDGPTSYAARVNHRLFTALVQPDITALTNGSEDNNLRALCDIAVRLKGGRLAIMPSLPMMHELYAEPHLADELLRNPLLLSRDDEGAVTLGSLVDEYIRDVRASDLTEIVRAHQRRALLSVDSGHFELPSGAHTSHFFRLAECLANTDDIDRIVYWIARDILLTEGSKIELRQFLILVDNPSTLIIALRVAQVFPTVMVRYDCVRAYPENPNGVSDLRQWLQPRLGTCRHIHCVVSVSSTGGFTRALSSAAIALGVSVRFSVLYSTTKEVLGEPYCALEIPGYWHSETAEHCEPCATHNSAVFRIDKARYFLTERNVTSVALPPPLFKSQRNFIEKYGAIDGVLRVHVNDLSWKGGQHRAFGVNINALIQITAFKDEVAAKINEIVPTPDLVIVPTHPGAVAVAEFLARDLGMNVVTHPSLRLDPGIEADFALAEHISAARSLLIVDDVAYTLERMQSYVKAIRESGDTYRAPPNVTIFPLLALPPDEDQLAAAIRGIDADHAGRVLHVITLYRFPLPEWDEKCCPWCIESHRIRQVSAAFGGDDGDNTDERGVLLDDLEQGLSQRNWMSVHGRLVPPPLGNDSPLLCADASAIQVLFACASAVQQVRTVKSKNRLDPEGFPKSTVLGAQVIQHFQNETLLIVCLLRSLLSTEMAEAAKTYLRDMIVRIGSPNSNAPDLWALQELLLAQMRGLANSFADEATRAAFYKTGEFAAFLLED